MSLDLIQKKDSEKFMDWITFDKRVDYFKNSINFRLNLKGVLIKHLVNLVTWNLNFNINTCFSEFKF